MNINQAAKLAKMATGKNLPVYENISIQPTSTGSKFTAMNGSIRVVAEFDGFSNIECAVDASKFMAAISKYSNPQFEQKDGQLIIKENRSRATIPSVSINEMPLFVDMTDGEFVNVGLCKSIQDVSFAAAENDVRQYLNGICIQSDGQSSYAVATNGHMMAFAEIDGEGSFSAIIPNSALSIMSSVEAKNFSINQNKAKIESDGVEITINLVDGKFPDWKRVVPKNQNRLNVKRSELLDALGKVSIVSSDKMQSGIMSITSDNLTITSRHSDSSEAQAMIDCEANINIDIGINIRYLTAAANAIKSENLVIEYGKETDAILFKDNYLSVVVMPIRV